MGVALFGYVDCGPYIRALPDAIRPFLSKEWPLAFVPGSMEPYVPYSDLGIGLAKLQLGLIFHLEVFFSFLYFHFLSYPKKWSTYERGLMDAMKL